MNCVFKHYLPFFVILEYIASRCMSFGVKFIFQNDSKIAILSLKRVIFTMAAIWPIWWLKKWHPFFSHSLVHNEHSDTKKLISAQKSHGITLFFYIYKVMPCITRIMSCTGCKFHFVCHQFHFSLIEISILSQASLLLITNNESHLACNHW